MANLSHSLSKKPYTSNGHFTTINKPLYDDVFGAPPKYGLPTLSPRPEDYREIFGGFNSSSKSSSIPFLDLPPVDDSDLFFDSRSSRFDYSEIFRGFNGLDFAVSYEGLVNQSNGRDDSSDEAWTPAQSESLSEESDPSACAGTNQGLTNGDSHQSFDVSQQFNIAYHKANKTSEEDMLSATKTHVSQVTGVPGYALFVKEIPPVRNVVDKNPPSHGTPDLNVGMDFGGGLKEGKRLRKTMSHRPNSVSGPQISGIDFNPLAGYAKTGSCQDVPFITVSDISLRTRPCQLPPPSRPPPALAVKLGISDGLKSRFKTSKSCDFGRMTSDSLPPFFDVEVDASASAVASAAAMEDAMEIAHAKLRSAKESQARKKEGVQKLTKLCSENDITHKVRSASKSFDLLDCFEDEKVSKTHERKFSVEESAAVLKTTRVTSGPVGGENSTGCAENPGELKQGKHYSSQRCYKTEGFVAWRGAAHVYGGVEKNQSASGESKDENVVEQNMKACDSGEEKKPVMEIVEEEEHSCRIKAATEVCEWEKSVNQLREAKGAREWDQNNGGSVVAKQSNIHGEDRGKVKVNEVVYELKESDSLAEQFGEAGRRSSEADKFKLGDGLLHDRQTRNELGVEQTLMKDFVKIEKRTKGADERKEIGIRSKGTCEIEEYETMLKMTPKQAETEKRLKETSMQEEKEELQREARQREEIEKEQKDARDREEIKTRLNESLEQEERGNWSDLDLEQEENKKHIKPASGREQNENSWRKACKQEENEKRLNQSLEEGETAIKQEAHEIEENEKRLKEAREREEGQKRLIDAWEQQLQEAHESEESEQRLAVAFKEEGNKDYETDRDETRMKLKCNQQVCVDMKVESFKAFDAVCELDDDETPQVTEVPMEHDENCRKMEAIEEALSCGGGEKLRTESKDCEGPLEAVEEVYNGESVNLSGWHQDNLQHEGNHLKMGIGSVAKSIDAGIGIEKTHVESDNKSSRMASGLENANVLAREQGSANHIKRTQFTFALDGNRDKFTSFQVAREWVENGKKMGGMLPAMLEEKKEKQESLKRNQEMENDHLRKLEEEREREREREKDRMAVDRMICEARERAFTEARERVERAAVERATSEVRQRAMAEARERLEKASTEAREKSLAEKASTEARLRAERAAVERATAEARERAFEKVRNDKTAFDVRERVERSVSDKFSASSRSGGVGHSSSSSDLQFQSVGSSDGLRYQYSSVHGEVEGESAQRCKARLERHQRTAERAAKALAEKNMRDLLAQREQAERNRLAETLDAEVKRWSSGKEGNLRALLSTLQYILGPDGGWQPIPLTEVITSAAVKKAYRKATLYVHPDKLQQRGASIQQKYICEKVFDLLKEAWNKFNSEER